MQIRAATMNINAMGMASERNIQRNGRQAQPADNMFGPSCKVTISQEGKRLSRQQTTHTENSASNVRAEKLLLRRQEESRQNDKIMEGYRAELNDIENQIKALSNSYTKEADKETTEKEQEVLRAMRNQKQAQTEESERRAKEARQMATQFAGYQEEVDEHNRDLLIMLRSIEESEKAEEERENGGAGSDGIDSGASGTGNSVSDVIQSSATQFMTSSVKREWGVQEMLSGLSDEGHQLLDFSNTFIQNVMKESENVRAALDDERYTDDDRAKLMKNFKEEALSGYADADFARRHGLHIQQEAQEYKIRHIADNPLGGMQETKKSMMLSAADAVVGEAMQSSLDEASQELKDEVERLIDERNSLDRIQREKEEEEEEKKMVQAEEQEIR